MCTVLLLTTFNHTDPMKADSNGKSIIPNLTPDQLAKRLVAIGPTKPLIGRPSISFDRPPPIGDLVVLQENHYLILIPIRITKKIDWVPPSEAIFSCTDLLTINKLIADLQNEQIQEEEIEFYKEKLNFYEHAGTSDKRIEELKRRYEALEVKREQFKREKEEQDTVIRRCCQQRMDEGAHNQMNDRESESSLPIRLCRCSSPLHQDRFIQYTSDSDSSIHDDDDDDERNTLSRTSVYQWLNTHPDSYPSFGKLANIRCERSSSIGSLTVGCSHFDDSICCQI